jgi:serine protease
MNILNRRLVLLASTLTVATAGLNTAAAQDAPLTSFEAPTQMVKIADKVDFVMSLTPPKKGVVRALNPLNQYGEATIYRLGASFIKLHFKQFDLPAGAWLQVSNHSGTESYRYGAAVTQRDGVTFDAEVGEDGVNRFAAMSITGDKLILKLVGADANVLKQDYNVFIDYMTQGFTQGQEEVVDSLTGQTQLLDTCGTSTNRKAMMCYQNSHPKKFERARPIARLITHKGGSTYTCTTWRVPRVGKDNHMFTNNHCVSTQTELDNSEIWFNHLNTQCGGNELAPITKITGKTLFKINADLDYSLYSVDDFSSISGRYNVTLTVTDTDGRKDSDTKSVSVQSDQTVTINNGQTIDGVGAGEGQWQYFKTTLEEGETNMVVTTSGGSGDADLHTKFGAKPMPNQWQAIMNAVHGKMVTTKPVQWQRLKRVTTTLV